MIGFFRDENAVYRPIDAIESFKITYDDSGNEIYRVVLKDGEGVREVKDHSAIRLAGYPAVPAEPGTLHVILDESDRERSIEIQPVIAWIIPNGGCPRPVTAQGIEAGVVNPYVTLHANGSVSDYGDQTYASLEEFLRIRGCTDAEVERGLEQERVARGGKPM